MLVIYLYLHCTQTQTMCSQWAQGSLAGSSPSRSGCTLTSLRTPHCLSSSRRLRLRLKAPALGVSGVAIFVEGEYSFVAVVPIVVRFIVINLIILLVAITLEHHRRSFQESPEGVSCKAVARKRKPCARNGRKGHRPGLHRHVRDIP